MYFAVCIIELSCLSIYRICLNKGASPTPLKRLLDLISVELLVGKDCSFSVPHLYTVVSGHIYLGVFQTL